MPTVLKFKPGASDAEPAASPMDRVVTAHRVRPGLIALTVGMVLAGGVGAFGYAKYGLVRSMSAPATRLSFSTVRTGLFRDYVPTTGLVAPRETVVLDSGDGGQVERVLVEQGAMVRAGQPLARLVNRRLELEVAGREAQAVEQEGSLISLRLAASQSELQRQQALDDVDDQIANLSLQIERARPLAEKGFYPRANFEDLTRQLASQQRLRANRQQARDADHEAMGHQLAAAAASAQRQKSNLALIRQELTDLTLTAPVAGQLTVFGLQPGQAVGAGQRIGQVDRVDNFKITVRLDEFYLGRVAQGQSASAMIDGRETPMRVAKVYPDVRERQFQADLEFEGATPAGMHAGQSLPLRIELGQQPDSLIVGNGAFFDDGAGAYVFVVSPDGLTAQRRAVRLGRRNPQAVEVLSGLAPGERIVTSSYQAYRDIQRLNITGGKAPATASKKDPAS